MSEQSVDKAPLNSALEIHDSELGSILVEGFSVALQLTPAYIHKSHGRPGVDPGTGWTQDVTILIEDAVVVSNVVDFPCDLTDGTLTVDAESWSNTISLPLQQRGLVNLVLVGKWGGEVSISGKQIIVRPLGEAKYVEDFRPERSER